MALVASAASAAIPAVSQIASYLARNPAARQQLLSLLGGAARGVGRWFQGRRRRAAARRRPVRNRVARGARGAIKTTVVPTPVAKSYRVQTESGARSGRNRAEVFGSEVLFPVDGSTSGQTIVQNFNPRRFSAPWIREMASHYNHFRIKSLSFKYVPRVGSNTEGTVILSPSYSFGATPMARKSRSLLMQNSDAKSGTARDPVQLSVNTARFSRGAGAKYETHYSGNGSEASIPGSLWVWAESVSGGSTNFGDIYVIYHYEFVGQKPIYPRGVASVRVDSTDASALGLSAATEIQGSAAIADTDVDYSDMITLTATNSFRFNMDGGYLVQCIWTGTNPVPDADGHTIADSDGTDVASVAFGSINPTGDPDSDMGAAHVINSATEAIQQFWVLASQGDVITLDTLTSGSITSFMLNVVAWDPLVTPHATTT